MNTNFTIITIFLIVLFSCRKVEQHENLKEIIAPSIDMPIIKNDSCISDIRSFLSESCNKCLISIDGDCSICLLNLPSIIKHIKQFNNIKTIIIVNTSNPKTFNAFCDLHSLHIDVVYDNSDLIFTENKILRSDFTLLSRNNQIISQGNPIVNKRTMRLYRKIDKN